MPTRDDIRDVIDARMLTLLGSAYTPNQAAIKAGLFDAVATGIVAWPGTGGGATIHTDTVDPDENADETAGYDYGSTWINTATPEEFVCVDPTNGAAVWLSTTSGLNAAAVAVIAAAAISAHVGAADPHTQYAKEADLSTVATTGAFSDLSGIPAAVTSLSGVNTGDQTITLTGDVTGSGTGSFAATLASIGSVTSKGSATKIPTVTIDAKGRVTSLTETAALVSQVDLYTTAGTTSGVPIPTWATTGRILDSGAGGGSGSGRRAAAATNAMGGGGGCGGGFTDVTVSAAALRAIASTYSVTVGAGGTAGAAVTVDSTNGNPGGPGGASSFSVGGNTYAYGPGGPGGPGGTATSAGTTAATAWQQTGGAGGAPGSASVTGGSVFVGPGGGGGGGWLTSAGGRNDGGDGGAGSKARDNHTGTAAAAGSGAAGVAPSTPLDGFCGDGAAGGAAGSAVAGGSGAAGIRGSGASGGGASRNGNNSGAGAVGGDGWVMVIWT